VRHSRRRRQPEVHPAGPGSRVRQARGVPVPHGSIRRPPAQDLMLWACAVSWRSRAASRWLIAPAHHCTASDTVKDSSVIISCNAAPARCSVAAMVASRSLSGVNTSMASFSGAGHAGPVHDDASHAPRMLPASASTSVCPYLLPSSTETRIPYGFSGWPSGHLLRCSLNGVLPQGSGNPMPHRLEPASP
jgi:hypothetical protein